MQISLQSTNSDFFACRIDILSAFIYHLVKYCPPIIGKDQTVMSTASSARPNKALAPLVIASLSLLSLLASLVLIALLPAPANDGGDMLPQSSIIQDILEGETDIETELADPEYLADASAPSPSPSQLPRYRALDAGTALTADYISQHGESDAFFGVYDIPDWVFARMDGSTFKSGCPVSRDDLRYVRVLHVDAEQEILIGELVVNRRIAEEICSIFRELYKAGYPIEKMRLADDYAASDELSMQDDNTSSFNFRPIEGTSKPSRHALGMAVDINTLYNPYYKPSIGVLPTTAGAYLDRSADFPYKIERGDLCYRLFTQHGYEWGGDWHGLKDYQHFEK